MGLWHVVTDADGMEVDSADVSDITEIDGERERLFSGQLEDKVDALFATGGIHQVGHKSVHQKTRVPGGLLLIESRGRRYGTSDGDVVFPPKNQNFGKLQHVFSIPGPSREDGCLDPHP